MDFNWGAPSLFCVSPKVIKAKEVKIILSHYGIGVYENYPVYDNVYCDRCDRGKNNTRYINKIDR